MWGGTREKAIGIADESQSSGHFERISPVKNSIKSIKSLASKNRFFIITSRPENWKTKTEKWVKRHLGNIDCKIIYTNDFYNRHGKSKSEICIEKGIKLILEDHGKYSLDCAKKGVRVILFDKPWNKKARHRNIIRVYDWLEAVGKINEIQKDHG